MKTPEKQTEKEVQKLFKQIGKDLKLRKKLKGLGFSEKDAAKLTGSDAY